MRPQAKPYPDVILFNGRIRSFARDGSIYEALACAGGRIVSIGRSDEVRRLAGPDSAEIDLRGRPVIPGLTDTHVHLSEKGTAEMELVDCRDFYTEVHSVADILERLARRGAETPKGSWIVAHGSPMQDFRLADRRFPDKHDLDRAVPDHLVSISFGAHITVANSKALAAASITRDTPDPPGGAIRRDPQSGEPTGELHERAQLILKKVAPDFDYLQLKDGIVFALNQCLKRGVTTVHDIVRSGEPVRAYQELLREDRLPHRPYHEVVDPAEQDHRDDVQLEGLRDVAPHRAQPGREQDAGQPGDEARHGEQADLGAGHVEARVAGHLGAVADDEHRSPEGGAVQHDTPDDEGHDGQDEGEGQRPDQVVAGEPAEPVGEVADRAIPHPHPGRAPPADEARQRDH